MIVPIAMHKEGVLEKAEELRNKLGELYSVQLDDSATVKTFYKEKDHIRLQPENDYMDPIIVEPDQPFQILGKVIGVFRFMR